MEKSVQRSLELAVKNLGDRLLRFREEEQWSVEDVAESLGVARPSYYRLEKGEPRSSKGWNLLQLIAFARVEDVPVSALVASVLGEEAQASRTQLDEKLLAAFAGLAREEKEAFIHHVQGNLSFAPKFSRAKWVARIFVDMMSHYTEAELAKLESDLHNTIMSRTTDEKELKMRSDRIIQLTGAFLKLQAQDRAEKDQSAKDKRK